VWSLAGSTPFTFENGVIFEDGVIVGYIGKAAAVVIPSQVQGQAVTRIWNGAFHDKGLTDVIIPDSVTAIGQSAFARNQLTDVTIPNSVTGIDAMAFNDNPLTSITIGANVYFSGSPSGYTVFNEDFDDFYNNNDQRAGTYTLNNGVWTFGGLIFYAGYVHDTDMNQLADRSKIKYGDGGETVIIYSNVDLYDFKIYNNTAGYHSDVKAARNVLSTSEYLEFMTNIPETMPIETVCFKTADGKEYEYLLGYSGMDGTVVAMKVEG